MRCGIGRLPYLRGRCRGRRRPTALRTNPGGLASFPLPLLRSPALTDRLRATEYSCLGAGGHVYLGYTGAGLPAQARTDPARSRGG
jgi:hypothetical protein